MVPYPNAIAKAFNVMCPADIDISDFGLIWANVNEANIKIMRIENCFAKAILLIEILGEAFLTQKELFCYVLV